MRLILHNMLFCNVKNCNGYPLLINVQKSQIIESDFKAEAIIKLIPKLDWPALAKTVINLGNKDFPVAITEENLKDEAFLKELHRVLIETHLMEAKLVCDNCKRVYPVVNGITNMILNEDEI